ncbi:TPA: LysR family transcriptional regulator [Klebsiella pneumoniae]|nr:LysR family transcriptional regulator [Klebsiella pneumoniae]HEE0426393.1 LysR family transcriptional regulator [Klebsiella pneumoniae]
MDIKQLKYLIALDQTRHFGQAAAACHITQPTLSMRIRNLEEELNLTLIQRGQRFEGFTPEGERILAWARAVLAAHDGLAAEAAICRGQMVGQLRVGMVPLASLNPMQLIKPLAEKYPALQFSLLSMTSEQIIDGVSRNQLDLGICYLQHLDEGQFKIARLPQTRMGLLHDKRHFDFSAGTPGWETLATLPLGFLTKGMYYRESIEISFKAKGLTPRYVFESDSTFQIILAVQAGICCAIMPLNNGLEALSDNLEILPIAETHVDSQLALIMRQQEPVSTLAEKCFAEAQGIFG